MNQTLVDNTTLDYLVKCTKSHINARISHAQTLNNPDFFQFEISQLKNELKHLVGLDDHFVKQCEINIKAIEIISTTTL